MSGVTFAIALTAAEWTIVRQGLVTEMLRLMRSQRRCKSPASRAVRERQLERLYVLQDKLAPPKAPEPEPLAIVEVTE